MSAPFAAAFAEGDPSTLAARCLAQLSDTQGATLGILYVSEPTALVSASSAAGATMCHASPDL